ncbi:MAG: hypothetical protein AB8B83_04220 [Bdellovibrionales bacterium]
MAKYKSKFHQYICEGFRWATFVSVIATLIVFLAGIWISEEMLHDIFIKCVWTTVALGVSSIVIMILFRIDDDF